MWRLFRFALCRIGAVLMFAVSLAGCDWDASYGSSGSRAVSDDDTTTPATESDTTPPVVLATTPAGGSTGVARTEPITAEFDEDVIASSVSTDSFTVTRPSVSNTSGEVSFDANTNTASFTPDAPLVMLESYTAILGTEISDLSGNSLAEDYAWSFTAGDGEWKTAALIENSNAGSAQEPKVALDSSGRGLAVWAQHESSGYRIWSNRYDDSWGQAERISDDVAAFSPQIALNNSGQALAVWEQDNGSRYNIWASWFDGSSWAAAELIQAQTSADALDPKIAIASDGRAVAVWTQSEGGRFNIYANQFNGTEWGTAGLIQANNLNDAWVPQISMNANGQALAVWAQFDGSQYRIWSNFFNGSGWEGAELVRNDVVGESADPQVVMAPDGRAFAVWAQSDGLRYNMWANQFDDGEWGVAELLETENSGSAFAPQVDTYAGESLVVVWQQSDGFRNNIWANRFNASGWETAELIETDNAGTALAPQIAVDIGGRALAVWQQGDGSQTNVWANRFANGDWGEAELIETETGGSASVPQIAFDAEGRALSVWHQFDGARDNIWANRFE